MNLNFIKREQIKEKFENYNFNIEYFSHSLEIWS